jgi:hypothetical protein
MSESFSVVPITENPDRCRKIGEKTDGTETQPCPYVGPALREFVSSFDEKTWYWSLTILAPGSGLPIHKDTVIGAGTHTLTRMHWPIVSTRDVKFNWYGEDKVEVLCTAHLEVGGAYAVNVECPHNVVNRGNESRIHLLANLDKPFSSYPYEQRGAAELGSGV